MEPVYFYQGTDSSMLSGASKAIELQHQGKQNQAPASGRSKMSRNNSLASASDYDQWLSNSQLQPYSFSSIMRSSESRKMSIGVSSIGASHYAPSRKMNPQMSSSSLFSHDSMRFNRQGLIEKSPLQGSHPHLMESERDSRNGSDHHPHNTQQSSSWEGLLNQSEYFMSA